MQTAAAAVCKVGYGIVSASATWDTSSGQPTLNEDLALGDSPRQLPNMTNDDLARIILAHLEAATYHISVDPTILPGTGAYASSFFQLLAAHLRLTNEDMDALLRPSFLGKLSATIVEGLATEITKRVLLMPDPDGEPAKAIVRISENRLHLRQYTLWPIVISFFLLSVFCITLLFTIPTGEDQLDVTGSIASFALVLVKSPSLLIALKNNGHYRSSQLKAKLENMHFITKSSRIGLQIEAFGSTREVPPQDGPRKKRPWFPLPVKSPIVVLTFGLPLLAIILLEILQYLSEKHEGMLGLDSSSSATLSYAVRLASTQLAFLIATSFNNLDFSISVFTPFSFLSLGNASAQVSILCHSIGISPFLILVRSLRLRQFGPAASNLSTLLASFLTIIVSGLWVIGNPIQISSASTATVQEWDTNWLTNNHDDRGAIVTLNIIRHGGAQTKSSMQGYDVLPRVSLGATTSLDRANNTYKTTVLRPVLDCDSAPQEDILITPVDPQEVDDELHYTVAFNRTSSPGCSSNIEIYKYSRNYGYGSLPKFSQLVEAFWVGRYWDVEPMPERSGGACPSTAIFFGKLGDTQGNGPSSKNNITALFCSQKIQEVPTTITYRGNPSDVKIDNVQLHLEEAKYWMNGTMNSTSLAFELEQFFHKGLSTNFATYSNDAIIERGFFDSFFLHIFWTGPRKVSPNDLLGPSNTGVLTEAITHSVKEYLAHVIDLNFRSEHSQTSIQGTSVQTTTRLTIHKISKIILQALLAATTVLSFVAYRLVKIRGTLPRNPCSIASTMGFLADSQLCDPKTGILPKDASLMNERELRQSLHGFVFSLGWWERSRDSNNSRPTTPSGEESSDLDAGDQQEVSESTYFGIDVGHTNALGFSKKEQ